jgi:hypothetical protein
MGSKYLLCPSWASVPIEGRPATAALYTPPGQTSRSFAWHPWRVQPHPLPPRRGSTAPAVKSYGIESNVNESGRREACTGAAAAEWEGGRAKCSPCQGLGDEKGHTPVHSRKLGI